jgi:uncharacterized protein (TIGR03437 family)
MGLTDGNVSTGSGGPSNPPANILLPASITLDTVIITPSFAGLAVGQPGVYQIDFTVPDNTPSGDLLLRVNQGDVTANQGLLPIRRSSGK